MIAKKDEMTSLLRNYYNCARCAYNRQVELREARSYPDRDTREELSSATHWLNLLRCSHDAVMDYLAKVVEP